MLTAEGQHFTCLLHIGYIPYKRVILSSRGIFLPEKRVLQDMICCPSAVNKCPLKRTYHSIFGKECFIFGYIICCSFRMKCLAPYTVPLGPSYVLHVMCHMSHVTIIIIVSFFFFDFFFTSWWSKLVECLLSMGHTPSSLTNSTSMYCTHQFSSQC